MTDEDIPTQADSDLDDAIVSMVGTPATDYMRKKVAGMSPGELAKFVLDIRQREIARAREATGILEEKGYVTLRWRE